MPETFTPFTWADDEVGGTPITAAQLNRIENGVESMDDRVAALESGGGVPDGSITNAKVATSAAISLDKTADATRLAMTAAERTKLAGVATNATANATDAALRDRATHTGTQPVSSLATTGTKDSTSVLHGDDVWRAGGGALTVTHQTGNYTLQAADKNTVVRVESELDVTITVPASMYSEGETTEIRRAGTGAVTIAPASDVGILSESGMRRIAAQHRSATLLRVTGRPVVRAVAADVNDGSTSTQITLFRPSGTVSGDVMLAFVADVASATQVPAQTGWTRVLDATVQGTQRLAVFSKVAGGSEPASYTFTLTATSGHAAAIVAVDGNSVAPITPVNASATSGQTTTSATSATVTPSVANTLVVLATLFDNGGSSGTESIQWASPALERADVNTGTAAFSRTLSVATLVGPASGVASSGIGLTQTGGHGSAAFQHLAVALAPHPQMFDLDGALAV